MTAPRVPMAAPVLGDEELANVIEAVRSGWISSLGAFIGIFERDFARVCGARHGVAVGNGTVALHLALAAAGIGPGDEVVIEPSPRDPSLGRIVGKGGRRVK